jgi:hypothetical protein
MSGAEEQSGEMVVGSGDQSGEEETDRRRKGWSEMGFSLPGLDGGGMFRWVH